MALPLSTAKATKNMPGHYGHSKKKADAKKSAAKKSAAKKANPFAKKAAAKKAPAKGAAKKGASKMPPAMQKRMEMMKKKSKK